MNVSSNCVNSGYGRLVFNEVSDHSKALEAISFLTKPELTINEVIDRQEELEEFLFLLRLELYRSNRPTPTKIKLNPNCFKRETAEISTEEQSELVDRLNHFESILRDRVGVEANFNIQTPLRRRRLELVNSLADAMKGQYPYQWLLPRK